MHNHQVAKHNGDPANFKSKVLRSYPDSLSRQAAEATFIRNMNCEILNSKSEFHQPSIITVRREISQGLWLKVFGVKTITFFLILLSINLLIIPIIVLQYVDNFNYQLMIRSQARNMSNWKFPFVKVLTRKYSKNDLLFLNYFRIKRKNSKNYILGEKPRKKIFFCGKKWENFYTQGVKTCKKTKKKKKIWPHQNYLLLLLDTYCSMLNL